MAGLILIVYTVANLPAHSMAYTIRPEYGIMSYILPSMIPIIIGVLLLKFPFLVSSHLHKEARKKIDLDQFQLTKIFCILIGIVFLFFAISDLIFYISTALILYFSDNYELSLLTFDYASAIATIIELGFSLVLIGKAGSIATFVAREKQNPSIYN